MISTYIKAKFKKLKVFFRRIHLYLGLAAGLILMVTCFTGAVLVYEKDLQQAIYPERYFVKESGELISPDSLISLVAKQNPKAVINGIKLYKDVGRTAEVSVAMAGKKDVNVKGKAEGEKLTAFVNPYTGQVLEYYNYKKSFFYFMMDLHRWMLAGDVGKMIVGVATLLFLFILITGIILWWPRNKAILKQRLRLKSDAGFKRLNHDYHIVLGFYSALFLFVLAFTGLAWSFKWFNNGIYYVTNSSMEKAKPVLSKPESNAKTTLAFAIQQVSNLEREAIYYNISLPKDSTESISVNVLSAKAAHESASDNYIIDAYTGEVLAVNKFEDKNLGARVRSTFKPVHTAAIFGWPSKLLGFLVCLLGTFFPASGIIMWWNRTRKNRKLKGRTV